MRFAARLSFAVSSDVLRTLGVSSVSAACESIAWRLR